MSRAATGTEILAVADAYAGLGEAACELAAALEGEDEATGLLQPKRARRSA